MAGRLDGQMDEYTHPGVNSYDRTCDNNVGASEQKEKAPQYTLQGALHFLQTEWTRLEMQRIDWETDRAELKARIAFLVGERRGQENLKKDLVRRIKMLEYALKQERVKFHEFKASVAAADQSGSRAPIDDAAISRVLSDVPKPKPLEPCEKLAQCTKQALESRTRWLESRGRLRQFLQEVGSADAVLNVRQARVLQLLMSTPGWRGAIDQAGVAIDPNVKQHLRLDGSWSSTKPDAKANGAAGACDENIQSALAEMEHVVRGGNAARPELGDESTEPDTTGQSLSGVDSYDAADSTWVNRFRRTGGHTSGDQGRTKQTSQPCMGIGDELGPTDASIASAVSSFISGLKEGNSASKVHGHRNDEDRNLVDFMDALSENVEDEPLNRPDTNSQPASFPAPSGVAGSNAQLSDEYEYCANPPMSQLDPTKTAINEGLVLGELATLTVANDLESSAGDICDAATAARAELDSNLRTAPSRLTGEKTGCWTADGTTSTASSSGHQTWQARYTLRGHLDGIRSVAFHPTERALYTAGEDGCVMLWNLSKTGSVIPGAGQAKAGGRGSSTLPMAELEPVHVYRGHDGPVLNVTTPTALMASTTSIAAYTGGLDGTIRAWRLPSVSTTTCVIDLYAPHNLEAETGPVLRGSRGAVWAMAMHPSSPILMAAHADNAIEFWSTLDQSEALATPAYTVHLDRVFKPAESDQEPLGRPTCLHYLVNRPDSAVASQCLVGTSTGWLFLLDVETGQVISQCPPAPRKFSVPASKEFDEISRNSPLALHALASHHTLPLVIGAHEDSCLRFYDVTRLSGGPVLKNSACVDTMMAHMDAISSLAVDAHGLYLMTGSHDASVRVWDLETRACVQEITNHRSKHNEAVNSVALHSQLPLAASAGADAVCKVYVTST